jgi:hypothetical protein
VVAQALSSSSAQQYPLGMHDKITEYHMLKEGIIETGGALWNLF